MVTSPNGVQPSSVLSDVAVSGGAIWAVGSTYDPLAVTSRTLTERWNGSSWTVVASPSPSSQYDVLEGIAAGRGGVWAVGASERLTLALRGS